MPLFISLTAGLVASIILIIRSSATLTSLIIVLAALLVFYVIGLIFRSVLIALRTTEQEKTEDTEDSGDGDKEDDEAVPEDKNEDAEE